jgi:hypothetical protein
VALKEENKVVINGYGVVNESVITKVKNREENPSHPDPDPNPNPNPNIPQNLKIAHFI